MVFFNVRRAHMFITTTFISGQWLHIWTSSIHNITTHDCYTDTATQDVAGTNTPVWNITVIGKDDAWPAEAREIMEASGARRTVDI